MNHRHRILCAAAFLAVAGILGASRVHAQAAETTWIPFPYVFYTPETSLAGGVILMVVNGDQNVVRGGGFASLNGQAEGFVSGEYFLPDDRMRFTLDSYAARFPNKFFGIGPDAATEEDYVPFECAVDVTAGFRLAPGLYLGPRLRWFSSWMQEIDGNGALAQGAVPGSGGAGLIAPGFRLTWEGRDSPVAPTRGFFAELSGSEAFTTFGSGSDFPSISLDARVYHAPFRQWKVVFAAQLVAALTGGDPPFQELPRLGGDELLRGYFDGRYRDRALLAVQGEVRIPVWWRFGVVVFAAAGQVAHDALAFRAENTKLSAGAGLRFILDEKSGAGFRADVAVGESGADFYFNLGEAF